MNIRWIRSNEILLAFLVTAMVFVGVLVVLVVRQQNDRAIDDIGGQVYRQTAPGVNAPLQGSTGDLAPAPSKSDISAPAAAPQGTAVVNTSQGTAVVNAPLQGSTRDPVQAPSKSDANTSVPSRHGSAEVNRSARSNVPAPAQAPSKSDRLTDLNTSPKSSTRRTVGSGNTEQADVAGPHKR
jgi:hypothetical protein